MEKFGPRGEALARFYTRRKKDEEQVLSSPVRIMTKKSLWFYLRDSRPASPELREIPSPALRGAIKRLSASPLPRAR
jgi:hypothetical protein